MSEAQLKGQHSTHNVLFQEHKEIYILNCQFICTYFCPFIIKSFIHCLFLTTAGEGQGVATSPELPASQQPGKNSQTHLITVSASIQSPPPGSAALLQSAPPCWAAAEVAKDASPGSQQQSQQQQEQVRADKPGSQQCVDCVQCLSHSR